MTKYATAFLLALASCHAPAREAAPENPPCDGFDAAGSDPRAIAIADEVMRAMGGRAAWDQARVLCWNFFGRRSHVWDKLTGDWRMDEGDKVVLLNVATGKGRVFEKGVELTDPEALAKALEGGRRAWINDSYWLVMPYKLKDSGVTLGYAGEGALADGRKADLLQLTFQEVGVTPDNRYLVFVGRDTHLVERWQYFAKAADAEPKMDTPWTGWEWYGGIRLASNRGEKRLLEGIQVLDTPPASLRAP